MRLLAGIFVLFSGMFGCQTKEPEDQCVDSRKMLETELKKLEGLRTELDKSHWVKEFLVDSMDLQDAKIARLIATKSECDLNIGNYLWDVSSPNRKLRFITWNSENGGTMTIFSSVT